VILKWLGSPVFGSDMTYLGDIAERPLAPK
jgi:hypothetical protein